MDQTLNTPKPILEKPFKNSSLVICGSCQGRKIARIGTEHKECPTCLGEGVLYRVTEGAMKLYTTKDFNL